jgi:hypothetical protein
MKAHGKISWFGLIGLVLATTLACNALTATETAVVASPSSAPATAPTTEAAPAAPAASAPFELDKVYTNPAGTFTLTPPKGWKLEDGVNRSIWTSPDNKGTLEVNVTNTGYALDEASFESFAKAVEANFFAAQTQYAGDDLKIDATTKTITARKTFLSNNVPQVVVSIYHQEGQGVYATHMWADQDVADTYQKSYQDVFASLTYVSKAVTKLDLYAFIYTFTSPDKLFSIDVPNSWEYKHDTATNVVTESFFSPDGQDRKSVV